MDPMLFMPRLFALRAVAFFVDPGRVARWWLAAQLDDTGNLLVFDKPDVLDTFSLMGGLPCPSALSPDPRA